MIKHIHGYFLILVVACFSSMRTQGQPSNSNSPLPGSQGKSIIFNPGDSFFLSLFKKYPGQFDSIISHKSDWNVQVIYTLIDRGRNGIPVFQHYSFNNDSARYFYPASTVKLPVALLALQKLNELADSGIDMNSTMVTEFAYNGQSPTFNDPNTKNGRPTIAQYIKKIFLVSDNDAYNRLYEFLGQQYINEQLHMKGYSHAQVLHRLGVFLNEDENRHTNPIVFLNNENEILYEQPMLFNKMQYEKRNDLIGRGYYSSGNFINKPMNFSGKNRVGLEELHKMLISLVFPEKVTEAERFNISTEDRKFILKFMSAYPRESVYPSYDTANYYDAFSKYIFYGAEKSATQKAIRVFNKEGDAYGQLTDVAYVIDLERKIEFMVSATIYCNADGILNDDNYDYEKVGLPFLKNLGKALYEYELTRERKIIPELSELRFSYDK